jgi:hypothetical protein
MQMAPVAISRLRIWGTGCLQDVFVTPALSYYLLTHVQARARSAQRDQPATLTGCTPSRDSPCKILCFTDKGSTSAKNPSTYSFAAWLMLDIAVLLLIVEAEVLKPR